MKKYRIHSRSKTKYLDHVLNTSPSKTSFPFSKSPRFKETITFSPNKYYQTPNLNRTKSTSFGFGKKYNPVKKDMIDPGSYNIKSKPFQKGKGFSFGIGRDQYYKTTEAFRKQGPSPHSYNIESFPKTKPFYMGQRCKTNLDNGIPGPTKYSIAVQSLGKLSGHSNGRSTRIKTDYFQKNIFQRYDNKTPGPGSYNFDLKKVGQNLLKVKTSKHSTTFGVSQRLKFSRSNSNIGPGAYTDFSIFGDS